VASGWLASPGDTYVYNNPFYVAPQPVVVGAAPVDTSYNYLDYSQPIVMPSQEIAPTYSDNGAVAGYDAYPPSDNPNDNFVAPAVADAGQPPEATNEPPSEDAQIFEAARGAFRSSDYAKALREVDQAIKLQPNDPMLHEFRSLVLFAQGKYRDAAAGAYAVLSAGPGWTWETLRELYADPETYTRQLRVLEQYVREHPKSSDGLFLLSYHYLVLNHIPSAVKELQKFEKLVPQDKLAPQLIAAFTPPAGEQAATEPPPAP
jgi:tetratricopeptide (TPR) repeat protein